ncbi:TPA: hypothetical protein ACGFAU_004524 [Yersinia enterocolitica]|uniref:hypothetical protein n=1 Tax=Yersinia massiliensis TaxID=419257 RepID=UPI001CFD4DC5|nr:hypothetical protein [Yersinia massiliensis]MCB5318612.1 hypothetical protein [Yersinia massiliensis]
MNKLLLLVLSLSSLSVFANNGEKVAAECSQRADIVSFIISGANIGAGRMDMSNRIMPTITAEYYQVDKAKQWVTKTIDKMFSDPDMPFMNSDHQRNVYLTFCMKNPEMVLGKNSIMK